MEIDIECNDIKTPSNFKIYKFLCISICLFKLVITFSLFLYF